MLTDEEYGSLREAFGRQSPEQFVAGAQALVQAHPQDSRGWFLLGAARHRVGMLEAALEDFDRVLALQPQHVQALNAKAGLLATLGRPDEARRLLEQARERFPDDAMVRVNLGYLLEQQDQKEQALEHYDAALALDPTNRAALMNRGYLLTLMRRLPEAVANNEQFVARHPGLAVAHFNLAESLLAALRSEDALRASERALELDTSHADAWMVRGLALAELGRLDEAALAIDKACSKNPQAKDRVASMLDPEDSAPPPSADPEAIYLHRGFSHLMVCDWSRRERFLCEFEARLSRKLDAGEDMEDHSFAYYPLATPLDPTLHARIMRRLAAQFQATARAALPSGFEHRAARGDRIRLGYISPDFREHLNARLTYPIFRMHDRNRFEVNCYSLSPDDGSDIRSRVAAAADRFVDVASESTLDIARRIHADGIDILVDLAGVTANARPDLFAFRSAPVQVSYLGFPGTLGADYIQYRFTDRTATPDTQRAYWTEALAFLPGTFYIYDEAEPLVTMPISRADYGLPERGTVFCVFHNYYKIDPDLLDLWVRIAGRVDGSVLWFMGRDELAVANLRREVAVRGMPPERLRFAPLESRERYRARFRLADFYLDAHRFNAMTTACDALFAGLPILTCPGDSFPSRVCASLLSAMGLEDCIMPDPAAYEEMAVRLACDPQALRELAARVAVARGTGSLFDSSARVAEIERAFETMWQRHCEGRAPVDFDVVP